VGGTDVGHDVVSLGPSESSRSPTNIRNSGADVLILANSGQDAAKSIKLICASGMQKHVHCRENQFKKRSRVSRIASARYAMPSPANDISGSITHVNHSVQYESAV
jgi:hypothetical protein